ncbi:MAG: hypothetical protein IK119_00195 [Bacteroidales bacterium]|nr:hypothetical protein [Bacteroidales bacterium]
MFTVKGEKREEIRKMKKKWWILALAIVVIAAVVLAIVLGGKKTEPAAEETVAAVEETAKEAVEEAGEKAEEAAAAVEETTKEAVEEAGEKVEEAAAAVEETAKEAVEEAKEKTEEAAAAVEETAKEAVEEAKEVVEEAKEKTEEAAAAVEEAAKEVAETAKVMSHDEYAKADVDSPVVVESYVQASQGWWAKDGIGRKTLYLQSEDGAYFAYEVLMEEAEAEKMVPGTKIRLEGIKAEWSGEVEIIDAKYEILEGSYIAEPTDVTALLGKDELASHMNEKIAIKGAKVVASKVEGKDEEFAFLYNWDGSGSREGNSDLYFNVEVEGQTYTLTVESYLCGADTDVYKAVEGLKVGDTIDLEGFLYWYNGANPHITGVTVK